MRCCSILVLAPSGPGLPCHAMPCHAVPASQLCCWVSTRLPTFSSEKNCFFWKRTGRFPNVSSGTFFFAVQCRLSAATDRAWPYCCAAVAVPKCLCLQPGPNPWGQHTSMPDAHYRLLLALHACKHPQVHGACGSPFIVVNHLRSFQCPDSSIIFEFKSIRSIRSIMLRALRFKFRESWVEELLVQVEVLVRALLGRLADGLHADIRIANLQTASWVQCQEHININHV